MLTLDKKRCYGAKQHEIDELQKSVDMVNRVLAHKDFYTIVMKSKFKETDGDTNLEIYKAITRNITIGVSFYNKWFSKVIGWTNLGEKNNNFVLINANRKYWNMNDYIEDGSNILHEVTHGVGYMHNKKPWYSSVPYMANSIYSDVVEIIAKEDIEKLK